MIPLSADSDELELKLAEAGKTPDSAEAEEGRKDGKSMSVRRTRDTHTAAVMPKTEINFGRFSFDRLKTAEFRFLAEMGGNFR